MLKMYHAEVLAKFPVVQHFPFGGLFRWEADPNAETLAPTVHTKQQRSSSTTKPDEPSIKAPSASSPPSTTQPPTDSALPTRTSAPWTTTNQEGTRLPIRNAPPDWLTQPPGSPAPGKPMTAAPWSAKHRDVLLRRPGPGA
jgi:serine/threonine-protein phosphatase 2A activator